MDAGADSFDPTYGMIVRNKDEFTLPLDLETIPTGCCTACTASLCLLPLPALPLPALLLPALPLMPMIVRI